MKSSLNKVNDVNATIAIELEKADYQEKVEKSLNQFRQRANIPGFRQGKVPKGLIQKMYGKSILAEELNKLVNEELIKYIRENKLQILGEPLPNETEQKELDFDKDENFEFLFDVALSPEFELSVGKKDKLTYYNVKLENELLDKQMAAYKQNYGTYAAVEEDAKDTDLIKGTLTEVENGADKEDGQVVENAILMPSYVKDEEIRNRFIGAKVGDSVVFNPKTAYDNNEAEIASLLQTTKENVQALEADFRFDVKEITRYQEAEINQELFDKVLGEGVVSTEEEFRTKIADSLEGQFKPNADYLFIREAREMLINKMSDVQFPEEFLKRWLLLADSKNTEESLEKDFPKILSDLKFHVAKEKIVEMGGIEAKSEEVEALAEEVAKAQFAQYGMANLPADMLQNYTKSMLEKEETVRNLFDKVTENKIIDWLKQNVKVTEKEIASDDFSKLLQNDTDAE